MAKPRVISARPTYPERAKTGAVPIPRGFIGQTIASLDRMGSTSQFRSLQGTIAGRVGDPGISALGTRDLNLTRSRFKGTPLNVPRIQEVQFDAPREVRRKETEVQFGGSLEGFDPFELGGSGGLNRDSYNFFPHGPVSGYSNLRQGGKVTKRR
jgi:hypothetical protein